MLESRVSAQSQVQGDCSGARNPEIVGEFGCVCGFRYGQTTISKRLIFKFGRLQRASAEELACTGKGILALVAAAEDILLQVPEELWALTTVVAVLAIILTAEHKLVCTIPGPRV